MPKLYTDTYTWFHCNIQILIWISIVWVVVLWAIIYNAHWWWAQPFDLKGWMLFNIRWYLDTHQNLICMEHDDRQTGIHIFAGIGFKIKVYKAWIVWLKCDGRDYNKVRTLWLEDMLIYHGEGSYNRRLVI